MIRQVRHVATILLKPVRTLRALDMLARFGTKRIQWLVSYSELLHGGNRSLEMALPYDQNGAPLPWFTYPAIEYLSQLDFSKSHVFEWGSGNSSKYWSIRCAGLTSIESDSHWYNQVSKAMTRNQVLRLETSANAYVGAIHDYSRSYDLIVIDGLHRFDCAVEAINNVAPGGNGDSR